MARPVPSDRPSVKPGVEKLEDRTVPNTYWVTNTLDAGAGSLRAAVAAANAHPGADDIRFKQPAWGTITLASQLLISDAVDIDGPGAGKLTVSGGNATRVFNIAAGVTASLEDLTVANGKVTGNGAGILNLGTLTLDDVTVSACKSSLFGAGIANGDATTAGTLTVRDSLLTGNTAGTAGGGVGNARGTVVIDKTVVSNNVCVGDGAGLANAFGPTILTVTGSHVVGNVATGFGTGGIASYGQAFTLLSSEVAGNKSAAAGIYLFNAGTPSTVLIRDSDIHDNAGSVGGIWSDYFSNNGSVIRIEGTQIRNNTGRSYGGIRGGGAYRITDSAISGNTGESVGGVLAFQQLTLTRSTVSGNTGGVGGVSSFGPTTIVESTISGNTGTYIGGISAYDLDLVRSTVSGNTATPVASPYYPATLGVGGVAVSSGRIVNSTISGNTVAADNIQRATGYFGNVLGDAVGGVFVRPGLVYPGGTAPTLSIDNTTIAFNRVTNARPDVRAAGGVGVGPSFSFTFYGNTYSYATEADVRNTIIARNTSNVGGPDVTGSFVSGGHNLIGVLTADASGFVASDLHGTAASPLDPKLRPLAYRGGPTQTHALMPGSPAINAGDNAGAPATDQRGHTRILGGVIDIGAYESGVSGDDDRDDRGDDDRSGPSSVVTVGGGPGAVSVSAASLFAVPDFPDGRPRIWFLRAAGDRTGTLEADWWGTHTSPV